MLAPYTLNEFVQLQHRLLARLRQVHPEFFAHKWLVGSPSKCEMCLDGESWVVLKHGVGVLFKRLAPTPVLLVDVHTEIEAAERIDAWRLQQFVESTGKRLEFNEAEELLQREVDFGVLIRRARGGYALCS